MLLRIFTPKSACGPAFWHACGKGQGQVADWYQKSRFHFMKSLLYNLVVTAFPPTLYEFWLLHCLTKTWHFSLFYFSFSSGYIVVSHCGLFCNSLISSDVKHLFICLLAIYMSFSKRLYKPFCLVSNALSFYFYCVRFFYTYLRIVFCLILLENIFCGLTFYFLSVSFEELKVFSLDEILFFFLFVAHTLFVPL